MWLCDPKLEGRDMPMAGLITISSSCSNSSSGSSSFDYYTIQKLEKGKYNYTVERDWQNDIFTKFNVIHVHDIDINIETKHLIMQYNMTLGRPIHLSFGDI